MRACDWDYRAHGLQRGCRINGRYSHIGRPRYDIGRSRASRVCGTGVSVMLMSICVCVVMERSVVRRNSRARGRECAIGRHHRAHGRFRRSLNRVECRDKGSIRGLCCICSIWGGCLCSVHLMCRVCQSGSDSDLVCHENGGRGSTGYRWCRGWAWRGCRICGTIVLWSGSCDVTSAIRRLTVYRRRGGHRNGTAWRRYSAD